MANSSAKPGLMPVPNIVEPPRPARLGDAVPAGTLVVSGDERRRRNHVDARRQDAHQLVDVDPHRVVDHAIRLQREQRVDVIGGGDTERFDAAQLADIAADLVRRPGVAPDELEVRVRCDRLHRTLADIARRPLDDSIRLSVEDCVEHSLSIGQPVGTWGGVRCKSFGSVIETRFVAEPTVGFRRLAEQVADELRRRILGGELADGSVLPKEDELLLEFPVSKPSLREAMRILEAEGLLRVRRGKLGGAVVRG